MSDRSSIEWTDATWNPVRGCSRVSQGCVNCYAEIMAARFSKPGQWGHGFAEIKGGDHRWTGKVALIESQLRLPLTWREPRRIFVNSTSDLFHENLPDEAIDRVFAVMALAPRHTYQILTKRPERMQGYLSDPKAYQRVLYAAEPFRRWRPELCSIPISDPRHQAFWSQVWLGTSCEDQETADERIPHLLRTPAAVRFVSLEPLLGPINLADAVEKWAMLELERRIRHRQEPRSGHLDWVIVGGESGPGARPMHPDWARSLRDQCAAAGVPFFFKQWGEWLPGAQYTEAHRDLDPCEEQSRFACMDWDGDKYVQSGGAWCDDLGEHAVFRLGKKRAGRHLDGREHNEFPAINQYREAAE